MTGSSEKDRLEREVTRMLRGSLQNYLELALDYGGNGLYDEGIEVLSRAMELKITSDVEVSLSGASLTDGSKAMAYYYVGLLYLRKGEQEKATKSFRMASIQPTELVFPFRLEAHEALEAAIEIHPDDSAAHYYLGNLVFENQPEKAIGEWERSRALKPGSAAVHRNLGIAYARLNNDIPAALASLEKAVEFAPEDPRLHLELDQLSERGKVAPADRLARLEENQKVVDQDYSLLMREASLYVQVGNYAKAIDLLESRHFHVWEGGGRIHDIFVDAHLARGQQLLREGDYSKALRDFRRALDYPLNLEVGRPSHGGRAPEVYYYIALAEEALGSTAEAKEHLKIATSVLRPARSPLAYYQALALRRLGQEEKAAEILNEMVNSAEQSLAEGEGDRFFAKFGERESEEARLAQAHFLLGLGYLGRGQETEARAEFEAALGLNLNHVQVRRQLAAM
jgi:tetratricopeptide (TPR) repeat protein